MEFMGTDGNQVRVELAYAFEGLFAEPLHCVGVEEQAVASANCAQLGDRLDRSDFVIGGHNRNQDGVRSNRLFQGINQHQTGSIYRQVGSFKTFLFCQIFDAVKDGVVLDGGCDNVPAFRLQEPGDAENGQIGALGSAAGENNLTGFTLEY